ncbi:DUF6441 family protein [Paenirhodobacter enshiensis]|uniref:Uncharacterized protein n=1 Tax=Paenirhodobacter enshiensis TaxID=1105367 RepID=A0A086XQQ4_9RHOB|nr:DUF6441 family protein [Paenirhodobacter enshiensis]KFI24354.1 hypothetical protein CG50_10655 [Paenirhodobacter enshiensis]
MIGIVPFGDIRKIMAEHAEAGAEAVARAAQIAGAGLKEELRAQVRAAGLGDRLARTFQSATYPAKRPSMSAAALVYSKAPKIVGAFSDGVTIRSKSSGWIAIPTDAAGLRGSRGEKITPKAWEARTGIKLRYVYRRGKPALLVADGMRISKAGRAMQNKSKVNKRTGIRRGEVTVPIFTLVPQVELRKRLDLAGPVEKWSSKMAQLIPQNWKG